MNRVSRPRPICSTFTRSKRARPKPSSIFSRISSGPSRLFLITAVLTRASGSYFISSKINGWVLSFGIANTFYVLAGISAGIASTTILMYRYGKVARLWVHENRTLFGM